MKKIVKNTTVVALSGVMAIGMLSGCGSKSIDGEKTVATVDGTDIPMGVVSLYARESQAQTVAMYKSFMGSAGNIWSQVVDEDAGTTYGEQAAKTLGSINRIVSYVSVAVIVILLLIAIFLISNTISVAAAFRRRENEIMRYIGATNFMIRAPFIVEGLLLGLFGAVIPLAGMTILYKRGLVYLNTNYQMITGLFELLPLKQIFPVMAGAAMALGVGIGAIVSFLTIQRHLRV
mgnify:CR=1 FL=1